MMARCIPAFVALLLLLFHDGQSTPLRIAQPQRSKLLVTVKNGDTDALVGPLNTGTVIDLSTTPRVTVQVEVPDVFMQRQVSVRFVMDGVDMGTESGAPFYLKDWTPIVGSHTLKVTVHRRNRGRGRKLGELSVSFAVVNSTGGNKSPAAPSAPVGTAPTPTPPITPKTPTAMPKSPIAPTMAPKSPVVPTSAPKSPVAPTAAPKTPVSTDTAPKSPVAPTVAPKMPAVSPTMAPAPKATPNAPIMTPTASTPVATPAKAPTKAPTGAPVKAPTKAPVAVPTPVVSAISIVITEIFYDAVASGTDSVYEWIEVYNAGSSAVNLQNWKIADNFGSNIISSSVPIAPGAYAVLAYNSDSATNGGVTVNYMYGTSLELSNTADEVTLTDPSGVVHDRVAYGTANGFADPTGASIALKATNMDNSIGSNWCASPTPWAGNTNGDKGTPGAANDCVGVMPVMPQPTPVAMPVVPAPTPVVAPVPVAPISPSAVTKIHAIQGTGSSVTNLGATVTIIGIATSIMTNSDVLDGFFVQEEDADADGDALTSEGIFVYCRTKCTTPVSPGDKIQAIGVTAEAFGTSQVDVRGTTAMYAVLSSGNPLPTPVQVNLPVAGGTKSATTFEHVEGMLATFPGTLAVSEYYQLSRYGQIVLTESSRPHQFTELNAPSVSGYTSFLATLDTRRIILDDDNDNENDSVSGGDEPIYYPTPGGLSLTNKFRGGDTIVGLTGVLQHAFSAWRIRPVSPTYSYSFASTNPAPQDPPSVGNGRLRVVSFNVLNFFTSLNAGSNICGPSGGQECRGANSEAELTRQRDKIVAALVKLNADIVGMIEMQNANSDVPAANLVSALNSALGSNVYTHLATGAIGTDAIRCGFIYKVGTVAPFNAYKILNSSINTNFIDTKNRPVLIQTFREISSGAKLTVAVNHFKSKGSACSDVGDPDLKDGQANCAKTRLKAANALAAYLATDPTGSGDSDSLIIGDLNSYAMEESITALKNAGYVNLAQSYGYVFDGQIGSLDYALASASLAPQVTGATEWHINSDEIPVFDYNDGILDTGEAWYERESNARNIYAADPFRSSDHDPILVGLSLTV